MESNSLVFKKLNYPITLKNKEINNYVSLNQRLSNVSDLSNSKSQSNSKLDKESKKPEDVNDISKNKRISITTTEANTASNYNKDINNFCNLGQCFTFRALEESVEADNTIQKKCNKNKEEAPKQSRQYKEDKKVGQVKANDNKKETIIKQKEYLVDLDSIENLDNINKKKETACFIKIKSPSLKKKSLLSLIKFMT